MQPNLTPFFNHQKKLTKGLILALVFVLVGSAMSFGQSCGIWYASASGSGTLATPANPVTLNYAVANAPTNTEIRCLAGTYSCTQLTLKTGQIISGGWDNTVGSVWRKNSSSITQVNISPSVESIDRGDGTQQGVVRGIVGTSVNNWALVDLRITITNPANINTPTNNRGNTVIAIHLNNCTGYNIFRCIIITSQAGTGAGGSQPGGCGSGWAGGGGGSGGGAAGCSTNCSSGAGGTGSPGTGNVSGCGARGAGGGGAAGRGASSASVCGWGNNYGNDGGTAGGGTSGCYGGTNTAQSNYGALWYEYQGATGGNGGGGGGGGGSSGNSPGTCSCVGCGAVGGYTGYTGLNGGSGGTGGWDGGGNFGIYAYTGGSGNVTDCLITIGAGGTGGTGGAGQLGCSGSVTINRNCNGCVCQTCSGWQGVPGSGGDGGQGGNGCTGRTALTFAITPVTITTSNVGSAITIPNATSVIGQFESISGCTNSEILFTKGTGNFAMTTNQVKTLSSAGLSDSPLSTYFTATGLQDVSANGSTFKGFANIITARTLPAITVTSATICLNTNIAGIGTTTTGTNYEWRLYDGVTYTETGTAFWTSSSQNPGNSAAIASAGTWTLRLRVYDACCGWSRPVYQTITVKGTPTASLAVNTPNICLNGTQPVVTFTATPNTTVTYTINGGGALTIGVGAGGTATVNAPTTVAGTFNYSLTSVAYTTAPGCTNSSIAGTFITVTVFPAAPTSVTATANSLLLCTGSLFDLNATATNATSWSWTGANSFASTSQDPSGFTAVALSAGNYTVTATNACGSTASTPITLAVTAAAPSSVTATANSLSLCVGGSFDLNASATGATSWSWTGANSFTSTLQDPAAFGTVALSAGNYTVTATNVCGSTASTPITLALTAAPPSSVTATANSLSLCVGGSFDLNASATGATSWSWTGANSFTSTLQDPAAFGTVALSAGNYTVTATNVCGSTASTPITLALTAAPPSSVTATANSLSLCVGGSFDLNASATGATSWSWTGANSFTSTLQDPAAFGTVALSAGNYTVTATNVCGSTASTPITLALTAAPPSSVTATANSLSLCVGGSFDLNASATGATSWSWTGANSFTSTLQDPAAFGTVALSAGNYTVTATNVCGSTASTPITLALTAAPPSSVTATANSLSLCVGGSFDLNASATGATSWSWTGANSFTSTLQDPAAFGTVALSAGNYTVTATNVCGSTASTPITLALTAAPPSSVTATANSLSLCVGGSFDLNASATGATSWSWTGANSFTSTLQDPAAFGTVALSAGNYTVTATNVCGSTASTPITLALTAAPPSSVTATANSLSLCVGGSFDLNASATGATSWSWTGANSFTSTLQDPAAFGTVALSAGNYTVTATNVCGSTASTPITLALTAAPPSSVVATANSLLLCVGGSFDLNASSIGATSWSWTGANSYSSTSLNPPAFNTVAASAGTYTITATNVCGSTASTPITLVLTPTAPTSVTATANSLSLCVGGSFDLNASATGATSWSWTGANSFTSAVQDPAAFTTVALSAGNYTVRATNVCGFTDSSPITLAITAYPVVSAPTVTQPVCDGNNGTIVVNATGGYEYSVNNGSTWQTGTSFSVTEGSSNTVLVRTNTSPACSSAYASNPVLITDPTNVTLTATSYVSCPGVDGNTTVRLLGAAGGSGSGYEYRKVAGAYQTSNEFSIANGTTVSFEAKDGNGCVSNTSYSATALATPTQLATATTTCTPCSTKTEGRNLWLVNGTDAIAMFNDSLNDVGLITGVVYIDGASPLINDGTTGGNVAVSPRHFKITFDQTNVTTKVNLMFPITAAELSTTITAASTSSSALDNATSISTLGTTLWEGTMEDGTWGNGVKTYLAFIPQTTTQSDAFGNYVKIKTDRNSEFWVHSSGSQTPLPVELVDFKALCDNDIVTINWSTATETNNDYFTVERSENLTNYSTVAVVEGAGNSNTYRYYSVKDQYPITGTSYYRLIQTDYNGQFEVFNPYAVVCVTKESDVIAVFPNPANNTLNVNMNLTATDRGNIIIYNQFGQQVVSTIVEPTKGVNNYAMDISNLVPGQYFVSFKMESKSLPVQKLIISR